MCACAEHPSACSQVSKPEVLHVSDSFQEICQMTEKETRRERELLAGEWGTGGHFRRLIPSVFRGNALETVRVFGFHKPVIVAEAEAESLRVREGRE